MDKRETLAREMYMWSEGQAIDCWHLEPKDMRNYWRNLASLAMQVLNVPLTDG